MILAALRLFAREFSQIFIPLHRKQVFLLVVALLAGRHEVSLGALSPPYQGDDMVHGQFCLTDLPAAIVTDPFGYPSLPPGRLPQFPGTLLLLIDLLLIYFDLK
jgi:hypothetical protein